MQQIYPKLLGQGWHELQDDGFVGLVGPFFFRREMENQLRFCFPTAQKHSNRNGLCQGGALFTFADRALGMTTRATTEDTRTATVQLDIHFMDAVKLGEIVEITPRVSRAGKHIVFVGGELKVEDRVVAKVNGIWRRLASLEAPAAQAASPRPSGPPVPS